MANSVSQLLYTLDGDAMGKPRIGVNFPDDEPEYTSAVVLFNDEYTLTIDKPADVLVTFTQQVTDDRSITDSTVWNTIGGPINADNDTVATYELTGAATATRFVVNYTSGTGLVKLYLTQEITTERRLTGAAGSFAASDVLVSSPLNRVEASGDVTISMSPFANGGTPTAGYVNSTGDAPDEWVLRANNTVKQLPNRLVDTLGSCPAFIWTLNSGGRVAYPVGSSRMSLLTELSTGEMVAGNACRHTQVDGVRVSSSSGVIVCESYGLRVPVLSTAGERMQIRWGLLNAFTNATPSNGIYVELDNVTSNFFRCVTVAASSSGVTVSTFQPAADTFYDLRMVVTNNTEVKFYARGTASNGAWTLIATRTTTIPGSDGQEMFFGLNLYKVAGTTARKVQYQSLVFHQEPSAS